MKASIVDLRYKSKQILAALERRETVSLQYRGKTKGYIRPAESDEPSAKVSDHAMFGFSSKATRSVEEQSLRYEEIGINALRHSYLGAAR